MHRRLDDRTLQLLTISTRFTQMKIGTSTSFGHLRYDQYKHFITETWTADIWRYLDSCGTKIVHFEFWNYALPRKNDFYLMDAVMDSKLSVTEKQIFNQLHLYTKVISVSDLIDESTNSIRDNIFG